MSVSQRELFVTVEAGPRGRDEAQASGGDLGDSSSAEPVSSDEHDQYDTVPSGTDGGSSTDAGSTGQTTADESDAAAAAAASDLEVVAAVEASMAVDPLPSNIGKMTVPAMRAAAGARGINVDGATGNDLRKALVAYRNADRGGTKRRNNDAEGDEPLPKTKKKKKAGRKKGLKARPVYVPPLSHLSVVRAVKSIVDRLLFLSTWSPTPAPVMTHTSETP